MWKKVKTIFIYSLLLLSTFSVTGSITTAQAERPARHLTWRLIDYPDIPPSRSGFTFTVNPINRIAMLFGGWVSTKKIPSEPGITNELWLFNGHQWMQFYTPHTPEKRSSSSMAYDEERQAAVLFGGSAPGGLFGDTWIFNGVDWIEQNPAISPFPRFDASIVYDPDHKTTYLFGGAYVDNYYEVTNDTWAWDGANWQEILTSTKPISRSSAALVYDPMHHNSLMFGGNAEGVNLRDTWVWDGKNWTEQHPLHFPNYMHDPMMAFDKDHQQVVLVGEDDSSSENIHTETWAWDGQDWTELIIGQPLPPRLVSGSSKLVYVQEIQAVVMFAQHYIPSDNPFEPTIDRSEVWALVDGYINYLPIVSQ